MFMSNNNVMAKSARPHPYLDVTGPETRQQLLLALYRVRNAKNRYPPINYVLLSCVRLSVT